MPPSFDATIAYPKPSPGSVNVKLKWFYKDTSQLNVIVPTTPLVKLFNPNDSQRKISDPSLTETVAIAPTQDVDNGFYVTVPAFPTTGDGAVLGTWYLQTTYTHESVLSQKHIAFTLAAAGATVSVQGPFLHSAQDVRDLLVGIQESPNPSALTDAILEADFLSPNTALVLDEVRLDEIPEAGLLFERLRGDCLKLCCIDVKLAFFGLDAEATAALIRQREAILGGMGALSGSATPPGLGPGEIFMRVVGGRG